MKSKAQYNFLKFMSMFLKRKNNTESLLPQHFDGSFAKLKRQLVKKDDNWGECQAGGHR